MKIMKGTNSTNLETRLTKLFTALSENEKYSIEDPANSHGNDLSDVLNDTVRNALSAAAESTLATVDRSGWEAVFGSAQVTRSVNKVQVLSAAAAHVSSPTRPWARRG